MLVGRLRPVSVQPRGTPPVAASRLSKVLDWTAPRTAATSATVLPCGPGESWVWAIGTTPARLTSPTVGLSPTTPEWLAGQTMLPSVSVPIPTAVKFADTEAADPELDPQGL